MAYAPYSPAPYPAAPYPEMPMTPESEAAVPDELVDFWTTYSYKERETAKSFGAKFCGVRKAWYAPVGLPEEQRDVLMKRMRSMKRRDLPSSPYRTSPSKSVPGPIFSSMWTHTRMYTHTHIHTHTHVHVHNHAARSARGENVCVCFGTSRS